MKTNIHIFWLTGFSLSLFLTLTRLMFVAFKFLLQNYGFYAKKNCGFLC